MSVLKAPDADGSVLASPAFADVGAMLESNAALVANAKISIAGLSLAELRGEATAEVQTLVTQYHRHFGETLPATPAKFLVGGHQPEMFHVGVWVKNFALHRMAHTHSLTALNLIVDNDTIKKPELTFPLLHADPAQVQYHAEAFDHLPSEIPYEEYRVHDHGFFATFAERVSQHTRSYGYTPLLARVWPDIVQMVERGCAVGNVLAAVRRQQERAWGITNAELPVSRLSETTAFQCFTRHVLRNLPRFAEAYNGAIRAYRERNHLRSRNHPAPELEHDGAWHEAPFWVWHTQQTTRQKLYVRPTESGLELRANQTALPTLRDSFEPLTEAGWKLRPKALTLTLFVRLALAEAFIHGIGGGKYDEVTDDLVRRFFQMEPPQYGVVSATMRLPLPPFPATAATRRAAQRRLRDLHWNPQADATTQALLPNLVRAKEALADENPVGHAARRQWFRDLQRVTVALRPAVAEAIPDAEADLQRVQDELAANTILRRRDYAWPLFPETLLQEFFATVAQG